MEYVKRKQSSTASEVRLRGQVGPEAVAQAPAVFTDVEHPDGLLSDQWLGTRFEFD